jgi:peptidyl-prolyl cis-trans isomerase D
MREKAQSWIIKLLFGIIIIVFVGFYGFSRNRETIKEPVVTVGEKKISMKEFQEAYKNMLQFYTNIYKNQLSDEMIERLSLKQQVLDQLINKELLLLQAKKLNIRVSKEEVRKEIVKTQAFQENGVFSQRAYERALGYYALSAKDFEKQQEEGLIVSVLEKMVTGSVKVSKKEIEDAFALEGETAKIEYVHFPPEKIKEEISVSEEESQDYYEKNKEDFTVPEKIKVKFLVFDPVAFEKKAEISEQEIADYYKLDPDQFSEEEKVRARHILFKVKEKTDPEAEEKIKKLAEKILEEINLGADFGSLAKKYSEDTVSAEKDGDLGFFPRGTMVDAFEKTAFSLKPGEVGPLVKTQFGFHIIKVEEIKKAGIKPIEEVRDEIIKELKKEKAKKLVLKEAKRAFNRLFKSKDLDGYAKKNNFVLRESGYFAYGQSSEDQPDKKDFSEAAFALSTGELAPVFVIGQKYYLVKLEDRQEQNIPELEKIKRAVEKKVREIKALEETKVWATAALVKLNEKKVNWKDVGKEAELKLEKTELKRIGDYVPGIGVDKELKNEIFSLNKDKPYISDAYKTERGSYLIKLIEKGIPEAFSKEKEKSNVTNRLLQKKKADAFSQYIERLKEKTEIKIDNTLFPSV